MSGIECPFTIKEIVLSGTSLFSRRTEKEKQKDEQTGAGESRTLFSQGLTNGNNFNTQSHKEERGLDPIDEPAIQEVEAPLTLEIEEGGGGLTLDSPSTAGIRESEPTSTPGYGGSEAALVSDIEETAADLSLGLDEFEPPPFVSDLQVRLLMLMADQSQYLAQAKVTIRLSSRSQPSKLKKKSQPAKKAKGKGRAEVEEEEQSIPDQSEEDYRMVLSALVKVFTIVQEYYEEKPDGTAWRSTSKPFEVSPKFSSSPH